SCIAAAGLAVYPLIEALRHPRADEQTLSEHRLNGKIAFTFGPFVLARDSGKEIADISSPVKPLYKNGSPVFKVLTPVGNEAVRLMLATDDGEILLTDYASCGKQSYSPDSVITVWMDT
nr:hypothetical protein [Clostridia bacterium]